MSLINRYNSLSIKYKLFNKYKEQYLSDIYRYVCINNEEKLIYPTFTPIFIGFEKKKPKDNLIIDLNKL